MTSRLLRSLSGARNVGTDYRAVVAAKEVDAIYVALPHALHAEVATENASAGVAVFLEKPLAATLAEGVSMLASIPDTSKVAVNYQYRYDLKLWSLVTSSRNGRLGEIRYVVVHILGFAIRPISTMLRGTLLSPRPAVER